MTGPEHYAEAERLLAGKPTDYTSEGGDHVTAFPPSREELAAAQVHATLALAAATVDSAYGERSSRSTHDWADVICPPPEPEPADEDTDGSST